LLSSKRREQLRRKAPQLIVTAMVIFLVVFVIFEFLEDALVEGTPITSDPLINAILSFTTDVTATVSCWGYTGIFVLMLLESSSLPVPSEVVLPFAGYLISAGFYHLSFELTVLVATIAAIIGSLIDYFAGLRGVQALVQRRVLDRVFFSMDQLEYAGKWFHKYGLFIVFFARLIPGLRTLISFPAGAARMDVRKFVALTTAGCLLWNSLLTYVGYYLGTNWREVAGVSQYIIIGVIVTCAILFIAYLLIRRDRNRK
jgi:membrane protein DedA with SNARE-associated domain